MSAWLLDENVERGKETIIPTTIATTIKHAVPPRYIHEQTDTNTNTNIYVMIYGPFKADLFKPQQ